MRVGLDTLAIRRPVAVTMFFTALVMLGGIAWQRLPVELFPALTGDSALRQLLPAGERTGDDRARDSDAARGAGPDPTWGSRDVGRGDWLQRQFVVRFERGSDFKVRELEMRRIAADLARTQPRDAFLNVQAEDTSIFSRIARPWK